MFLFEYTKVMRGNVDCCTSRDLLCIKLSKLYWDLRPTGTKGRFKLAQNRCVHRLDPADGGARRTAPWDPTGLIDTCIAAPPVSSWVPSTNRRVLDVLLSAVMLVALALPMLLIAVCVLLTSRGSVLFSQDRAGVAGRVIRIYKFRSMRSDSILNHGSGLTRQGDARITPLGRWMRKFKLDELPQFYNVLRGDMSLVGPRPKLPRYDSHQNMPYRPGITGAATLAFLNEEQLLRGCCPGDLERYYDQAIKPVKARLDVCYMCRATLRSDVRLIASTILRCLAPTTKGMAPLDTPTLAVYPAAHTRVASNPSAHRDPREATGLQESLPDAE